MSSSLLFCQTNQLAVLVSAEELMPSLILKASKCNITSTGLTLFILNLDIRGNLSCRAYSTLDFSLMGDCLCLSLEDIFFLQLHAERTLACLTLSTVFSTGRQSFLLFVDHIGKCIWTHESSMVLICILLIYMCQCQHL